ncbi:hypothetical protein CKAH01_04676 [Colletotrichum kahawae]|uniref:Uncharacterized protein n=1 Tax=Colletotrichum kahawae TaxID=34407 RepID=A0AAE0D8F8_COLKA|nr:hypothetical protein CKAH01_04676 [Colletotrichum kahawae]
MRLEELLPLSLIGVSCLLLPHPDAGPCGYVSARPRSLAQKTETGQRNAQKLGQ